MEFEIPDSVLRYIGNDALRDAVEHLLKVKPSKLDSYSWDEVPNFYRAYLAAQQVRAEWAHMLHRLWHSVWQEPDASRWRALTPDEQSRLGWGVDLEGIWERVMLARIFESRLPPERWLYLVASLAPDEGIQIGFGVFSTTDEILVPAPEGFVFDEDDLLHWAPTGGVVPKPRVDLKPLLLAAQVARREIGEADG